jgi:hypothetical protein
MNWHLLNVVGVVLSLIAIVCDPAPAGRHHLNPFKSQRVFTNLRAS